MSRQSMTASKLSIVIPLYHNEKNIPVTYAKLKDEVLPHLPDYELILIDDGSKDNSYTEALKLREQDDKIKVIKLSRNFGQHSAILAGLANITGDCALTLAADLQDPLYLVVEMFERWQTGEKVVFTARRNRDEKLLDKVFINIFARFNKLIFKEIPSGGIGFPLIDAKVAKQLVEMDERNSSIHYQLLWMGYHEDFIYFDRPQREIGKSSWTFAKKFKMFIDLTLSFSYFPVRLISTVGLIDCILSLTYAFYVVIQKMFFGASSGWSSLMVAIMFTSGVQMLTLGVIGEYLWRNFDASRKRPIYLIDEMVGFDDKKAI